MKTKKTTTKTRKTNCHRKNKINIPKQNDPFPENPEKQSQAKPPE